MPPPESPARIEPCDLDQVSPELADVLVDIATKGATLGARLHPRTAASLAELVAVMNSYYSNLIEGHHTRPRDIERALADDLDTGARRDLQLEARAHVRVQREIDTLFAAGTLGEPASASFMKQLHRSFYGDAPTRFLTLATADGGAYQFVPGEFRNKPDQDVAVGRHLPPSSGSVVAFVDHFARRFELARLGPSKRLIATAAAHHRFNYIHPFPDGNGRVSRLISHAMALQTGVGAHGLWAISRGLARGLRERSEYERMMDAADAPRRGDTDGRGNLSARALAEFVMWFCEVARDQLTFMSESFEFDKLRARLQRYVLGPLDAGAEAATLVDEVFLRGTIARGEAARITGRPERTAREILRKLVLAGLFSSETPKTDVFLRFSSDAADFLFPRLFPSE